jgi:hypothetical protein
VIGNELPPLAFDQIGADDPWEVNTCPVVPVEEFTLRVPVIARLVENNVPVLGTKLNFVLDVPRA